MKKELIDQIADKTGKSKSDVKAITEAFLATVVSEVVQGNAVELRGFGTFSSVDTKERKGRNPQTGEALQIEAGRKPKFKVGKQFKEAVSN